MGSEQQYIDIYTQARQMIFNHAPEAMNAVRDQAFEDFKALGFPSKRWSAISTRTCSNSSHQTMV